MIWGFQMEYNFLGQPGKLQASGHPVVLFGAQTFKVEVDWSVLCQNTLDGVVNLMFGD